MAQPPPHHHQRQLNSWTDYLMEKLDVQWVCGVEYFKHAPFGTAKWEDYAKVGLVVEIPNPKWKRTSNWPAKILGFAGYYALVEFVKINESEADAPFVMWVPFCSNAPKPLTYSGAYNVPYIPVYETDMKDPECLEKMLEKVLKPVLSTVKPDHWDYCLAEINATATRFKINEVVEALDKREFSRNRTGVIDLTLGNRIHVKYLGLEDDDEGFWFSQQSEHLHKMGWSCAVGCEVAGARQELIYAPPPTSELAKVPPGVIVEVNDVFEMRHPIELQKICVGRVVQPLRFGYFLAETDWTRPEESTQIVMHVTSDYILPLKFCRQHGIDLEPPNRFGELDLELSWKRYIADLGYKPLDLSAIKKEPAKFDKGWKMEAVYIKTPTYLGPATVSKVCGHLMQIHFDGYPRTREDAFQWVSAESPDIYPAGYCQTIGHKLGAMPERPNAADSFNLVNPSKGTSK